MIDLDIFEEAPIDLEYVEAHVKPEQSKTVTPTEERQTVEPDPGFALSSVDVEAVPWVRPDGEIFVGDNGTVDVERYKTARVEVPKGIFPSGTLEISENGTYDVTEKETANVNVPIPVEYCKGGSLVDKTLTLYHYPENSTATSLSNEFFRGCASLKTIENFPQNVKVIPSRFLYGCYDLETFPFPNGITQIGQEAFYNCLKLVFTRLPSSLTKMDNGAFQNCKALTDIVIPIGISTISTYIFMGCSELKSVICEGNITAINVWAFREDRKCMLYDFRHCTDVPTLAANAFEGISVYAKIVVPDALVESWKAAENWTTYANRIISASEYDALN